MAVCYESAINCSVSPSHIQLVCNDDYFAIPHLRTSIAVWNLADLSQDPLLLEDHRHAVTALTFSSQCNPRLLCSIAARDSVILWNMNNVAEQFAKKISGGRSVWGRAVCPVPSTAESVSYAAFSPDDSLIAFCAEKLIHVADVKGSKIKATLQGHSGNVNAVEFCPHYTSTVVSVSDDRTFKVWGISSANLLYQSTIISSSPFISLAMNPATESFAVGTADGMVRVYDLADGHDFRCIHQLDVNKLLLKRKSACQSVAAENTSNGPVTISSRTTVQRVANDCDNSENQAEIATNIVSLSYLSPSASAKHDQKTDRPGLLAHKNDDIVSDLLSEVPVLCIGTTGILLFLEATTLHVIEEISLRDTVASRTGVNKSLSLAGNVAFCRSSSFSDKIWCIVGKLFRHEVDVLSVSNIATDNCCNGSSEELQTSVSKASESLRFDSSCADLTWWRTMDDSAVEPVESAKALSVLSSEPLSANSPLKSELRPKLPSQKTSKSAPTTGLKAVKPGSVDKKGQIVDRQPVTFHSKVKSSGYSRVEPKTLPGQPRTKPTMKNSKSTSSLVSGNPPGATKLYPVTGEAPVILQGVFAVAERSTSINSLRFNERSDRLACALSNNTVVIYACPLKSASEVQLALSGHSQAVTCANWSHDGQYLITSSDDKTANIWSHDLLDPLMTFATTNQNLVSPKDDPTNVAFSKPVCCGQFYYMDRFLLLASGNSFYLYKYHLDVSKSDLQRYASNNKYKMVKSFPVEKCQQITALSSINSFHSYIVLCAGSDKSVHVFDMNVGAVVSMLPDVHNRPVHSIVQNSGSQFVSHSNAVYDLFLTSAVSDGVKLWDLRSNRCVRRYEGHTNRVHQCKASFSPCCRYIATGSEDKSAYLYDIRSGSYLHKLAGHSETVTSVAFNSRHPQLVTATLDGKLRLYSDTYNT